MANIVLGVDVGGTFTDFAAFDRETGKVEVWKCLTTPRDPVDGVITGLGSLQDTSGIENIRLGTTVVTNALLERNGATVAYITTEGFRDVPFMQRGHRKAHYDPSWVKSKHYVLRRHALEVCERINHHGQVVTPLDEAGVRDIAGQIRAIGTIKAVALCFLHSYASPRHEKRAREILAEELPDMPVSISFDVIPKWKEYERASTTILDAYVKPLVAGHIDRIADRFAEHGWSFRVSVIKSNGGEMTLESAAQTPINLAVSGPTGGVIAAKRLAGRRGIERLVTLDMGGTSTDCAAVVGGEETFTTDFEVEFGIPISVPVIDIRSIGAGGGSIAWIDKGGMLRVGPQSARATPGPACYGRGGTEATVTDANVMLGRLDPANFLGGTMRIDRDAAVRAVTTLADRLGLPVEETALAILQIANNNIVSLLRNVLTERGLDPRDFTLLAFGGAGPLHAGELIRAFEIGEAMVPVYPGQFSAFGFTLTDARVDRHRTVQLISRRFDVARAATVMRELVDEATGELKSQGYAARPDVRCFMEARYVGQNYEMELAVPDIGFTSAIAESLWADFHRLHHDRFGFSMPGEPIEIVNFRATAIVGMPKPEFATLEAASGRPEPRGSRQAYFAGGWRETPVYDRAALLDGHTLAGPALIEESASVTVVCPEQTVIVDEIGNLIVRDDQKGSGNG